jgi:hypothetical protein
VFSVPSSYCSSGTERAPLPELAAEHPLLNGP